MDATFHGGSNDTIGGRVRLRRPEISLICPDLQKERTFVVIIVYYRWKFIGGVVDTSKQFIGGVFDTGDNIFPQCRWYRSEKAKNIKFIIGVNDTAE